MGILQCIKRDGQNYYVACDNLGSPKTITDNSGKTIQVLEYDSYGRLIADSNPDFTIAICYAGGLDDKNGLIRFGARDYDPIAGRWTAKVRRGEFTMLKLIQFIILISGLPIIGFLDGDFGFFVMYWASSSDM